MRLAGFTELRRLSRWMLDDFPTAFATIALHAGNVTAMTAGPAVDLAAGLQLVGFVAPGTTDEDSGHDLRGSFPVNDVAAKGKSAVPELHHVAKRWKPIAPCKRFAFIRREFVAVDLHDKARPNITVRQIVGGDVGPDFDLLDLHAGHTHQQLRTFVAQAGVEMQNVSRLVRIHAHFADG